MDSTPPSRIIRAEPVRAAGPGAGQLLLPSGAGVGGEPGLSALAGRGIYPASVLWGAQNDGLAAVAGPCGGAQTGAATAAGHGFDGGVSQAPLEPQPLGPPAVSLFVEGVGHRAAQPSLEHRHHLHSAARRVCVSDGGHRLVQSLCVGLGDVDHLGSRFLCGRAGAGDGRPATGDPQHGPGGPNTPARPSRPRCWPPRCG